MLERLTCHPHYLTLQAIASGRQRVELIRHTQDPLLALLSDRDLWGALSPSQAHALATVRSLAFVLRVRSRALNKGGSLLEEKAKRFKTAAHLFNNLMGNGTIVESEDLRDLIAGERGYLEDLAIYSYEHPPWAHPGTLDLRTLLDPTTLPPYVEGLAPTQVALPPFWHGLTEPQDAPLKQTLAQLLLCYHKALLRTPLTAKVEIRVWGKLRSVSHTLTGPWADETQRVFSLNLEHLQRTLRETTPPAVPAPAEEGGSPHPEASASPPPGETKEAAPAPETKSQPKKRKLKDRFKSAWKTFRRHLPKKRSQAARAAVTRPAPTPTKEDEVRPASPLPPWVEPPPPRAVVTAIEETPPHKRWYHNPYTRLGMAGATMVGVLCLNAWVALPLALSVSVMALLGVSFYAALRASCPANPELQATPVAAGTLSAKDSGKAEYTPKNQSTMGKTLTCG